jgi:tetratricopeptide (TPR) repeat protein
MTKEELKEDLVATAAAQAVDYARRNARWVMAAAGAVVLAIVVALVVAQGRTKGEREASIALMKAQNSVLSGNYAEALPQLEALAGKYGSTSAGREGRLFLGAGQLAAGNATAAEAAFRKFLSSRPADKLSEAAGRRGLAGALADQGKHAESADEYQKSAQIAGNPLAADDWLQAGLAFQRAGKKAEAVKAFQAILTNFPRASVVNETRIRLREASGPSGS